MNIGTEERITHSLLRLIGDMPMQHGRIRASRIVMGYPVALTDETDDLSCYAVAVLDCSLTDVVKLVDVLIEGNLIAAASLRTVTRLALTRAGHLALDALEAMERH